MTKEEYQAIIEDLNRPLWSYPNLTSYSSEYTGIKIKGQEYLIVLDYLPDRTYMIKLLVNPDCKKDTFLVSISKSGNSKYKVKYNKDLQEYVDKTKDAIKLAALFYDRNTKSINSYYDIISSNCFVTYDKEIAMAKSWVKVNEEDKIDLTIEYEKV